MNPDDLRAHLRTTLDTVSPSRPSTSSLRSLARRRVRRLRVARGAAALVAIAGAGTGIALTAGGSSGTDRVVPATAPSSTKGAVLTPTTADVPCRSGQLTAYVGQTISFHDCPSGSISVDSSDPSVLAANAVPEIYPSPPPTFTAKKAGTANLTITARPTCTPGTMCSQLVRDVGVLDVTVVEGTGVVVPDVVGRSLSDAEKALQQAGFTPVLAAGQVGTSVTVQDPAAGSRAPAGSQVVLDTNAPAGGNLTSSATSVPCTTSASYTLSVGDSLLLQSCPSAATVGANGSAVRVKGLQVDGVEPGTATVTVTRGMCGVAPTTCQGGVDLVATVTVTVTEGSSAPAVVGSPSAGSSGGSTGSSGGTPESGIAPR